MQGKIRKNDFFGKSVFSTREATFQRCSGTLLWTGVTRTPRLPKRIRRQNHGIPNLRGTLPAGLCAEPTHAGAENAMEQNTHTEAPVAPCVANETVPTGTDTPNEDKAV